MKTLKFQSVTNRYGEVIIDNSKGEYSYIGSVPYEEWKQNHCPDVYKEQLTLITIFYNKVEIDSKKIAAFIFTWMKQFVHQDISGKETIMSSSNGGTFVIEVELNHEVECSEEVIPYRMNFKGFVPYGNDMIYYNKSINVLSTPRKLDIQDDPEFTKDIVNFIFRANWKYLKVQEYNRVKFFSNEE